MMDHPAELSNVSRVTRSKREARSAYDRLSGWYDWLASSEGEFTQKTLEMAAVQPGESVLEIGFGSGKTILQLAQQTGASGWVSGIDLSWGMAALSRRKLSARNLAGRVLLNLGDGVALPYPAQRFDLVFMAFTLELFDTPELAGVLGECRRILRAGGRLALVSMSRRGGFFPMAAVYEWVHRHFPAAADCRPIPAKELVQAAGFEICACQEKLMWGLPVLMMIAKKVEYGR